MLTAGQLVTIDLNRMKSIRSDVGYTPHRVEIAKRGLIYTIHHIAKRSNFSLVSLREDEYRYGWDIRWLVPFVLNAEEFKRLKKCGSVE